MRVIGVVEDYRIGGELSLPGTFLFHRKRLDDPAERPSSTLLVEFDPGRARRAREAHRGHRARRGSRMGILGQAAVDVSNRGPAGVLGAGVRGQPRGACSSSPWSRWDLPGVFWQSIAQRRSELGVRRAAGATARGIVGQIVGEVWAMVTARRRRRSAPGRPAPAVRRGPDHRRAGSSWLRSRQRSCSSICLRGSPRWRRRPWPRESSRRMRCGRSDWLDPDRRRRRHGDRLARAAAAPCRVPTASAASPAEALAAIERAGRRSGLPGHELLALHERRRRVGAARRDPLAKDPTFRSC